MLTKGNQYQPESVSHPGLILTEKLDELGMGNKEFAVRVDKPEKTITAVANGSSSITPEMAVTFEDVLKIPASFWLARQRRYDEYRARLKRQFDIEAACDWARTFPYAKMAKMGWLPPARKITEKVEALFDFFSLSNHHAWESFYFKQVLKVNFRISLSHTKEAMAVSAWLRQGEHQAREIEVVKYSATVLKKALPLLKVLVVAQPVDFFDQIQDICGNAGVKVVYTPCLPKAPIHGSTRWLNDTPLIQLSARYKSNDMFWFTFFHEVGHILFHGKKYISIENIKYDKPDRAKEKEADDFAVSQVLSLTEEKKIVTQAKRRSLTEQDVLDFASEFKTHPAIIIGRLQRRKIISFSKWNHFRVSINFGD